MSSLGLRIRARRRELGLTQSQIAGSELTKGFISLIEQGHAKPSVQTIVLLARRLQRPVGYFLEDDDSVASLRLMSAWAATALKSGEPKAAVERFSRALEIASQRGDRDAEIEALIGRSLSLIRLGEFDKATRDATVAKELIGSPSVSGRVAKVLYASALLAYHQHDFGTARNRFLEFRRVAATTGLVQRDLIGDVLIKLGETHRHLGEHTEAASCFQEALSTLEPAEDLRRVAALHTELGVARREDGDPELAEAHFARAEHAFEFSEVLSLLATARKNVGVLLLDQGQVDEAVGHLEGSLLIRKQLGHRKECGAVLRELARAFVLRRAFGGAERMLAEAEHLARDYQDLVELARIDLGRARLMRAQGLSRAARRHYKRALAGLAATDMKEDLAVASNEFGELLMEEKRPAEAAYHFARALRLKPPSTTLVGAR